MNGGDLASLDIPLVFTEDGSLPRQPVHHSLREEVLQESDLNAVELTQHIPTVGAEQVMEALVRRSVMWQAVRIGFLGPEEQ